MHVSNEVISGVDVEVHADGRAGSWFIQGQNGARLGWGDTKDKAMAQARTKIAKTKTRVKVEFVTAKGERGVATGLHASNGSVLAKIDGLSVQLSSYGEREVLSSDVPAEKVARMIELREKAHAAEREAAAIQQEYKIDILKAVTAAIAEVQAAAEAKVEPANNETMDRR